MGILIVSVLVAMLCALAGCLLGFCGPGILLLYAGVGMVTLFALALLRHARCKPAAPRISASPDGQDADRVP